MIKVTQRDHDHVPTELIAISIRDIGAGMKRIEGGLLNRKAITILLHHASGVSQKEIGRVLDAMKDLEKAYLKPKVPK